MPVCISSSCRLITAVKRLTYSSSLVSIATLSGCGWLDPYPSKFDQIAIGEARTKAVEVLGEPASVNSIEVPLVKIEQLAWRAPFGSRVYIVHTALGYVVSKSVIQ